MVIVIVTTIMVTVVVGEDREEGAIEDIVLDCSFYDVGKEKM